MHDTANAIARDLVAEVGRGPALGYLLGRLFAAQSWRGARQVVRLLAAFAANTPGSSSGFKSAWRRAWWRGSMRSLARESALGGWRKPPGHSWQPAPEGGPVCRPARYTRTDTPERQRFGL